MNVIFACEIYIIYIIIQYKYSVYTLAIGELTLISSPAYPPGNVVFVFPNNKIAIAAAHSSPAPSSIVTPIIYVYIY